MGISDPPREEAIPAVANRQAGIRVKMITGDRRCCAARDCHSTGHRRRAGGVDRIGTGSIDDAALRAIVWDVDVHARASPGT
ncbi:MAG: cation-transporting P-type ATPase [Candidatus Competibacteraceae bacterium]|nr:cation-transporting P-type ATPase [Candidatus Competibacteraceae bacterium]